MRQLYVPEGGSHYCLLSPTPPRVGFELFYTIPLHRGCCQPGRCPADRLTGLWELTVKAQCLSACLPEVRERKHLASLWWQYATYASPKWTWGTNTNRGPQSNGLAIPSVHIQTHPHHYKHAVLPLIVCSSAPFLAFQTYWGHMKRLCWTELHLKQRYIFMI